MTLEDLKKHVRPLVWEKDKLEDAFVPINCMNRNVFILHTRNCRWYSNAEYKEYETKEEAMQSVEEYHLRELAKYFELEAETKQERS